MQGSAPRVTLAMMTYKGIAVGNRVVFDLIHLDRDSFPVNPGHTLPSNIRRLDDDYTISLQTRYYGKCGRAAWRPVVFSDWTIEEREVLYEPVPDDVCRWDLTNTYRLNRSSILMITPVELLEYFSVCRDERGKTLYDERRMEA